MKIKTFASHVISSLQVFFFFADFVVKLMILCEVQEDSESASFLASFRSFQFWASHLIRIIELLVIETQKY